MADTIKRAVDIEVTIRHADTAKRDLRGVADATDKAAGSAQKLLRELLDMSGGLKSLGAAAADTGAQITSLENVERMATWFKKATKEVNEFEAAAAETSRTTKTTNRSFEEMLERIKNLDGSTADFANELKKLGRKAAEMNAEQSRVRQEQRLAAEAMKRASESSAILENEYKKMAEALREYERPLNKLRRTLKGIWEETKKTLGVEKKAHREYGVARGKVEELGQETKKAGGIFDFAKGKSLKFFGAIGLGIYSMYTFANAVRRGFGALKDFVKDGIVLALEKNKEFADVIKNNVNRKLDDLKLKLGQEVVPALSEVAIETGKVLDELSRTGVIEDFGQMLANTLRSVMPVIEGVAAGIKGITDAMKWMSEQQYGKPEEFEPAQRKTITERAKKEGLELTEEDIEALAYSGYGTMYAPKVSMEAFLPKARERYGAIAEAKAEAEGYETPFEEYARARAGGMGPFSAEMYKQFGIKMPKKEKRKKAKKAARPIGMGPFPEKEAILAPKWVQEDPEALAARAKTQRQELEKTRGEIELKDYERAAKAEAKRIAKLKKHAEEIGRLMDPTSFLIEGLKSKDMGKAAKDAGIMLGETMARELMRKLIISGVMQILTLITGGAAAPLQLATAQKGMYTGEHEGPVWVHPHEVIAPLDTISQMSKLINTAMVGGAPAAAAAPAPGGVMVNITEGASEYVDVNVAEHGLRGGEALSALEGA